MRDKAIYFLTKLSFLHWFMILIACSKEKENPTYVYVAPPPSNTNEGSARAIITAMGTGFNLGQAFDAFQHSRVPDTMSLERMCKSNYRCCHSINPPGKF